jgi:hypothetical protein
MSILQMPRQAEAGATWRQKWASRLREASGWCLNKIGRPGYIRDVEIDDEATGQCIQVRTGRLFTVISVNGRDYYFDRTTGRYDGTGMRRS